MHQDYIAAVTSKVEADPRIKAAWLEGSYGRGTADRYSDLDFHLLLTQADVEPFTAAVESWLATIQPVVLCTLMFDGLLVNALTQAGIRVDIVLHADGPVRINPARARVLVQKDAGLLVADTPQTGAPADRTEQLEQQTKEFWRCIALVPAVASRDELITGTMGLTVETQLLTTIVMDGYGIVRDRGVKNLNQFLPPDVRQAIEAALAMQGLSAASLTGAHLALARIMQHHGRIVAAKHGYPYPDELENAVLRYVHAELALLDLPTGQATGL